MRISDEERVEAILSPFEHAMSNALDGLNDGLNVNPEAYKITGDSWLDAITSVSEWFDAYKEALDEGELRIARDHMSRSCPIHFVGFQQFLDGDFETWDEERCAWVLQPVSLAFPRQTEECMTRTVETTTSGEAPDPPDLNGYMVLAVRDENGG